MILSGRYMIVIGLAFHCLYIFSIFDIYFRSPLVHGMQPHTPNSPPLADRLVLFVADGLRADKVFEKVRTDPPTGITRAPFLQSKAKEGQWGVSHAHVPTESRPGHVALIAGFYEDVSAVTRGWKTNPVEFDSFFNQSNRCWAWGSPDILPMFSLSIPHMYADSYPPEFEDFSREGSHLDTWVFEKLQETLIKAKMDSTLDRELREKKNVFFLHLLGIDSNGHAYRPYSKEYLQNIAIVDSGIEQAYQLIEQFFGDGKTAYIFTADHGMSNKGSHGDSEPANTLTPLIAWGSGIAAGSVTRPLILRNTPSFDDMHRDWPLMADSSKQRLDVEQGDIALLMSGLLGTAFPMNAVGVIPTEYLNCSLPEQAELLYTNAKQIFEQLHRKSSLKEESAILFRSYTHTTHCEENLQEIPKLLATQNYKQVIELSKETIEMSLEGLHYFQTYDWFFLMSIISLGFLGWMGYVSLFIYVYYALKGSHGDYYGGVTVGKTMESREISISANKSMSSHFNWILFLVLFSLLSLKLFIENAPMIYYGYCVFPVFFWCQIILEYQKMKKMISEILTYPVYSFGFLLITIGLLEVLVYSFFQREILSVCVLCIGLFTFMHMKSIWYFVVYVIMSLFPLLPVDFGDDLRFVYAGGLLLIPFVSLPYFLSYSSQDHPKVSKQHFRLSILQFLLIIASLFQLLEQESSLFYHVTTWSICVISLIIPFFSDRYSLYRFISVFIGFGIPFILLSINYEVLYYVCLGILLFTWYKVEIRIAQSQQSKLRVRLALFYLVFYFVAFFGTGNIASISSFEISSTYRFVRIFNPFLMGALLIFKILIPFILVCCCYILINRAIEQPESASFFTVINMYDIIALSFFFLVRDSGSWKDIGISISHYIVACAFIVIQLFLFCVSLLYLRKTYKTKVHIS